MSSPRFQCLNVVSRAVKESGSLRATFSTTRTQLADKRNSQTPSASNLKSTSASNSTFKPITPINQNPITLRDRDSNFQLAALVRDATNRQKANSIAAQAANGEKSVGDHFLAQDYSKQIPRRWKAGEVYAPHDLSGTEMRKWKLRGPPTMDCFDVLNFNPEEHYRNFSIMSEYMTDMGRIKGPKETGLRPVNQRRMARAIRRVIGIGMMPSVHRHPELLYKAKAKSDPKLASMRLNTPTLM